MPSNSHPAGRLPHVKAVKKGSRIYLYYSRGGRRWPLPGPEGGHAHIMAHQKVHAAYGELRRTPERLAPGTVDAAVSAYLGSADFHQLKPATQRSYRSTLDGFRGSFGPMLMSGLDAAWWEDLRRRYVSRPADWNRLRSVLKEVFRLYRRTHPGEIPANPMEEVKRLKMGKSTQNRPWPMPVLAGVLADATPYFRALLTGYILTAQRGSDVTQWRTAHYNRQARTIAFVQQKTETKQVLHVTASMAEAVEMMDGEFGKDREFLLLTSRGRPWKLANAQEMLATTLRRLELPRYTLHGLRATGPVALKMIHSMENRRIRTLTGHSSDANLETYLLGADGYELAREAQEGLEGIFGEVLATAALQGNQRKTAGVTGRAAAIARRKAEKAGKGVETGVETRRPRRFPENPR